MTNVLHLINHPGQGGSERYILSLANKLHGKECLFFLAHGLEGPLVSQLKDLGIETCLLPMKGPWDIGAAMKLKQYCKEKDITIIHTHFLRENYISILSKILGSTVRLVNTVHMMDTKQGLIKAINRIVTRFDDRIIVVSEAVKAIQQNEGISPGKIALIYNGVETSHLVNYNQTFRADFGLAEDEFVITSVARFADEKGHLFLLEAIKIFSEELKASAQTPINKVRFVLAGDGPLLESCKEKAGQLGIDRLIIFSGYCKDVPNLLKASNLFVSHSLSEALGISILEALSFGLPVVTNNSGGPSEIVNEETGCGILVDKHDAKGFANALIKMITDRNFYNTCSLKSRHLIEKCFSIDIMSEKTLQIYRESIL